MTVVAFIEPRKPKVIEKILRDCGGHLLIFGLK